MFDPFSEEGKDTRNPIRHTQQPVIVSSSVLGVVYKDGVMLASDTLASYGSGLSRFRDIERLKPVGEYTVVGASGDNSDFQYITHTLEGVTTEEYDWDDGHKLGPKNVFEYLHRLMYGRRNKMNPLWNSLVVGGLKKGEKFLGYIDLKGTTYQSEAIATGFGSYLAIPLLRKATENGRYKTLSEQDAKKLLEDCLRVLWYRDATANNKIQVATINEQGVSVSAPYKLDTEWGFAEHIRGYGA
ncbi:Proteasome subunit beta type-7 [Lobulomyces angularis]|nr:Proteasome subunit beta type-7 [Lobulomyces angularis]